MTDRTVYQGARMNNSIQEQITAVIAKTKLHKDIFAVPELIRILHTELAKHSQDEAEREEIVLLFVQKATEAIASSPIHSDTLVRDFYRAVLDLARAEAVPREILLEDLLFQSLRKPSEHDKLKRRKHADARAKILQAALDEFSEKGFHATTIDSIAERAGIAKGTVYRYFRTKEQLFNELKEDTIREFVEAARRDLSREEDILKIIESVIRMYLGFFERNSAFFKVIVQEQKEFGREFSDKFISELILALPGLKRRCWKASRAGRLKQMNYFTVFFGIIGFLNGVIQKWLHEGAEGSLLAEIETVKEVLFYGFVHRVDERETESTLKVVS